VVAGDQQSTIIIYYDIPVEGAEEFVYFGSKQSSNGYCWPEVLRRIGLDEFSTEDMELQFCQYQHQSTPVPSIDKVRSALRYRNIDHMNTP